MPAAECIASRMFGEIGGKPKGYLRPASGMPTTPKRPEGVTNMRETLTRAAYASEGAL